MSDQEKCEYCNEPIVWYVQTVWGSPRYPSPRWIHEETRDERCQSPHFASPKAAIESKESKQ